MSDITVKPVSTFNDVKPIVAVSPTYLLICKDQEKIFKFLANRFEEYELYIKATGMETIEKDAPIFKNYLKMMKMLKKDDIKQIMIPWQNVLRIYNLSFKQK